MTLGNMRANGFVLDTGCIALSGLTQDRANDTLVQKTLSWYTHSLKHIID